VNYTREELIHWLQHSSAAELHRIVVERIVALLSDEQIAEVQKIPRPKSYFLPGDDVEVFAYGSWHPGRIVEYDREDSGLPYLVRIGQDQMWRSADSVREDSNTR
jgi:hypothetical protein